MPQKWNRHRRGEPQEKADDQRAAYLGVSTCILGPVDMRLQSCCANNDVERWACTPVITSEGCVCLVGVAGVGTGTGIGNRRLLQACQVPRWTQLSSRMVDKRCAGTAQENPGVQVCSAVVRRRRSKKKRRTGSWMGRWDWTRRSGQGPWRLDPRAAGRWESRSWPESGSGSEEGVSVLNLSMMGSFWRRRSRSAQCGVVSSERMRKTRERAYSRQSDS